MDSSFKFPASPGTPLLQASPERVNQQRQSLYDGSPAESVHGRHSRASSVVHEKVAAFNSMSFQTKQGERKIADAALKRAMLGREEAEETMRKYRDDNRILQRKHEEEKEKVNKISHRYETLQENYCRLKETQEHTKQAYDKDVRRMRKESFKSQSAMVKLQEELKAARDQTRAYHRDLELEKDRSTKREQEAFAARYQLVGVQEELQKMQDQIKLIEQERDALRTIAKNEEVARIAAEGRLPLPVSPEGDEFASPKKARKSLDPVTVTSSAASEEEMDDLRMLLEWEQQRANRAHDRVEFLEAECRLNCCASRASRVSNILVTEQKSEPARSNPIYIPSEGVFRSASPPPEESPWISPAKKTLPPIFPEQSYQATPSVARQNPASTPPQDLPSYARTPSCEPPAAAIIPEANTSLLSLLDAPNSPSPISSANSAKQTSDFEVEEDENPTPKPARAFSPHPPKQEYTIHTISTTTRIPLANPPDLTPPTLASNPALSPTMTREEALAQIRERRGRARSLAQGTLTPRKQMVTGNERRDISAPAIRSGNVRGRTASRT